MARSRNIKPSFFTNEDLAELPFSTRLLFIGLWTLADREGLLGDRPKKIKMAIFPGDNVDVDAGLGDLNNAGFIRRYEVDGRRYIHVIEFLKHQNPHYKEAASTLPKPEALPSIIKPKTSGSNGNDSGDSLGQGSGKPQINGPSAGGVTVLIPDSLNPIPDSLQEQARKPTKPAFQMVGFTEFWAHYPRKGKRPRAEEAWSLLAPDEDLRVTILASLEAWKQSRQWSDKNFIPLPENWLKNRQFDDDVPRETTPVAKQDAAAKKWLEGPASAIEQ